MGKLILTVPARFQRGCAAKAHRDVIVVNWVFGPIGAVQYGHNRAILQDLDLAKVGVEGSNPFARSKT